MNFRIHKVKRGRRRRSEFWSKDVTKRWGKRIKVDKLRKDNRQTLRKKMWEEEEENK